MQKYQVVSFYSKYKIDFLITELVVLIKSLHKHSSYEGLNFQFETYENVKFFTLNVEWIPPITEPAEILKSLQKHGSYEEIKLKFCYQKCQVVLFRPEI